MIRLAAAGDMAGASRINDAVIRPLADALFAPPVRNYRARVKEALRQQGVLPSAHVRPPLLELDEAECATVTRALAALPAAVRA
jgi:dihydrodipicolinate synthase/N-acetylneuraminate lyase